jgi:hypothetical protein
MTKYRVKEIDKGVYIVQKRIIFGFWHTYAKYYEYFSIDIYFSDLYSADQFIKEKIRIERKKEETRKFKSQIVHEVES